MKRVKIMLTAITVLAVVGGALAFKAQRFSHKNVFCSTFPAPNTCQVIDAKFTNQTPALAAPCGLDASNIPLPYYSENGCITADTRLVTTTTNN